MTTRIPEITINFFFIFKCYLIVWCLAKVEIFTTNVPAMHETSPIENVLLKPVVCLSLVSLSIIYSPTQIASVC